MRSPLVLRRARAAGSDEGADRAVVGLDRGLHRRQEARHPLRRLVKSAERMEWHPLSVHGRGVYLVVLLQWFVYLRQKYDGISILCFYNKK